MARYIAKNIVAAGLASRAEVQLAYAIGVAEPVSVMVNTFGTGTVDENKLTELVRAHFSLTPKAIIDHLQLRRPIYKKTAAFGHFGRKEDTFTWEKTDKAEALKAATVLGAEVLKVLLDHVLLGRVRRSIQPPCSSSLRARHTVSLLSRQTFATVDTAGHASPLPPARRAKWPRILNAATERPASSKSERTISGGRLIVRLGPA
jgi:hypothetical protein